MLALFVLTWSNSIFVICVVDSKYLCLSSNLNSIPCVGLFLSTNASATNTFWMRYLLPGSKIFCELEPSNLNSAILEVITESSVNNLGLVLVSSTLEYCNLTLFSF
ncbi:hypothetical protein [Mesomycoplasma hyorhinis]|uniref:hypothetical protein n=1 Tax=Mesomycoplasma hyorhinis TaxID=2100 RepID=UPI001C0470EC|nr:hypothetical protein [Mesomycoplasma hyorhinis]